MTANTISLPAQPQLPLADEGLRFDQPVASSGYRWWYVDAFSADGSIGMTLIVFIGSVFSPYYFRARRHSTARPENHVSINAIFYQRGRKRWALTERGHRELTREKNAFHVGPSHVVLNDDTLTFAIDEWCVPLPSRLRGMVSVRMRQQNTECYALDTHGLHRWWPISPVCDVQVDLDKPKMSWRGLGYLDSNGGTVPLEQSFKEWHWMRLHRPDDSGTIFYDCELVDGSSQGLALAHAADGSIVSAERSINPDLEPLPSTAIWRMGRAVRSGVFPQTSTIQAKTLEDTPFYARSGLSATTEPGISTVMHESLQLQRFSSRWVQALLPFRMPRRAGW